MFCSLITKLRNCALDRKLIAVVLRTVANVKDLVEHHGLVLAGTRTPRFFCFYLSTKPPQGMPASGSGSSSSSDSPDVVLCVTKDEEKQQWSREATVIYAKRVPVLDWSATPPYHFKAVSPQMISAWREGILNLRNIYARNIFSAKDALEMVDYVDWMTDTPPVPFTWIEEGLHRFGKESALSEEINEPALEEPSYASRRVYTSVTEYRRSKVSFTNVYSVDQVVAVAAKDHPQRFWLAKILERCRRQGGQTEDDYKVLWYDAKHEYGKYFEAYREEVVPVHQRRAGSKKRTKAHIRVPAVDTISGAAILCVVVLNAKSSTIRASSRADIESGLELWAAETDAIARSGQPDPSHGLDGDEEGEDDVKAEAKLAAIAQAAEGLRRRHRLSAVA